MDVNMDEFTTNRVVLAVKRFIATLDPDFKGDLAEAMTAIANVAEKEGWAYDRGIVGDGFFKAVEEAAPTPDERRVDEAV